MSQPPRPPRPPRSHPPPSAFRSEFSTAPLSSLSSPSTTAAMTETAPPLSLPPAPYARDAYPRHMQGPIQLPPLNIPALANRPEYSSAPPLQQPLPPIQTGSSAINQPRSFSGPVAPLQQILSSDPYHPPPPPPRSDAVHSPYGSVTPPRSAVDNLHPLRQERTVHELQRSIRQEPQYHPQQVEQSVRPPPPPPPPASAPVTNSPSFTSRHGSTSEPYRGSLGSLGSIQSSASSQGTAPYPEPAVAPAPRAVANPGRPAPGPTMK